jgi:hypothetical protein
MSDPNRTLEETIAGMEEELRSEMLDIAHENRRLRTILDTLARAGVGLGALVEVQHSEGSLSIVVCRADRDEMAFMQDVKEAVEGLARAMGGHLIEGSSHRTGVTR